MQNEVFMVHPTAPIPHFNRQDQIWGNGDVADAENQEVIDEVPPLAAAPGHPDTQTLEAAKAWLQKPCEYAQKGLLGDKLFAHIHGDAFIGKKKSLEGHNSEVTLTHLISYLASLTDKSPELVDAQKSLQDALDNLIKIKTTLDSQDYQASASRCASHLRDEVIARSRENPPKPFTLSFGYTGPTGGHAMLLQFSGTTFRVFNTGGGVEYHANCTKEGKIRMSPVLIFEDISLDPKTLETFFRGFIECRYPDMNNPGPTSAPFDSTYVYESLLPVLHGRPVFDPSPEQDFMMDQSAGICAEKSLHAFLRYRLPRPDEYKRFKLQYYEDTLKNYYKDKVENSGNAISDTEYFLLRRAISKHAYRLEKLHEQKIISDQEWKQGISRLSLMNEGFDERIKMQRKAEENQLIKEAQDESEIKAGVLPYPEHTIDVSIVVPQKALTSSEKTPLNTATEKSIYALFSQPFSFSKPKTIDELQTTIKAVEERIGQLKGSGNPPDKTNEEIAELLTQFFNLLDIPDPTHQTITLWDQCKPDQARAIVEKLQSLGELDIKTEMAVGNSYQQPVLPDVIFSQAKLLSITRHLTSLSNPIVNEYSIQLSILESYLDSLGASNTSFRRSEEWKQIRSSMITPAGGGVLDLSKWITQDKKINKNEFSSEPMYLFIRRMMGNPVKLTEKEMALWMCDKTAKKVPWEMAALQNQQINCIFVLSQGYKAEKEEAVWTLKAGVKNDVYQLVLKNSNDKSCIDAGDFGIRRKTKFIWPYNALRWKPALLGKTASSNVDNQFPPRDSLPSYFDKALFVPPINATVAQGVNSIAVQKDVLEGNLGNVSIVRELNYLTIDPKRIVPETIQFFNRYPNLFEDVNYRTLLETYLFKQGALECALTIDPHLAQVLINFINSNLEISRQKEDISQEVFFLRLALNLKLFIEKYAPNEKVEWPKTYDRALEIMHDPKSSDQVKYNAAFLLLQYGDTLDSKEIESSPKLVGDLLGAWCVISMQYNPEKNYLVDHEPASLWNKLHPAVSRCSEKDVNAGAIADEALKVHPHDRLDGQWIFDKDTQTLSNGAWALELKKGKILFNGLSFDNAVNKIIGDQKFLEFTRNKPVKLTFWEPLKYRGEFVDENGTISSFFVYLNDPLSKKPDSAISCFEKIINGKTCVFLDQVSQNVRFLIRPISYKTYWLSKEDKTISILDEKEKVLGTILLNEDLSKIQKVVSGDLFTHIASKDQYELLSEPPNNPIPWWVRDLKNFDPDIEIWTKSSVNPPEGTIVRLPNCKLEFEIRNNGKELQLYCVQKPDFYLKSNKSLRLDQPKVSALILQKEGGAKDERILLPLKNKELPPFMEFILNSKGKISPRSSDEHLYLAYLALLEGDDPSKLKEAERHLRLAWSVQKPSKIANEIIEWIAEELTKRNDPTLAGLYLKLFCQIKTLELSSPPDKTQSESKISSQVEEAFSIYLKRHHSDPLSKLSHEEEKIIIDHIRDQDLIKRYKSWKYEIPLNVRKGMATPFLKEAGWSFGNIGRSLIMAAPYANSPVTLDEIEKQPTTHFNQDVFFRAFHPLLLQALSPDPLVRQHLVEKLSLIRFEKNSENSAPALAKWLITVSNNYETFQPLSNFIPSFPCIETEAEQAMERLFNAYINLGRTLNLSSTIHSERDVVLVKPKRSKSPVSVTLLPVVWSPISPLDFSSYVFSHSSQGQPGADPLKLSNYATGAEKVWLEDVERDYAQRELQKPESISLVKEEGLGDLSRELETKIADYNEQLSIKATRLFSIANRIPDLSAHKIHRMAKMLTGEQQTITSIDQLLFSYLKGTPQAWREINPWLDDETCQTLDAEMSRYLQIATEVQALKRSLQHTRELQSAVNIKDITESERLEIEEMKESLGEELFTQRAYSPDKQPASVVRASLLFEYLGDIRVRKKQIDIIQNILSGKVDGVEREFIIQLIMGGGKSKVIVPLLNLLISDGKKLAVFCVPKEQLQVQRDFLNRVSADMFGRRVHTLHVDRAIELTPAYVHKMWRLIKEARKKGECLMVSPETFQALSLKWEELHQQQDIQSKKKVVKDLAKIFNLLHTDGVLVLDEASKVLDVRNELNFALGDAVSLSQENLDNFNEIYDLLLDVDQEEKFGILENRQAALFESTWPSVKRKMAEKFADRFCLDNTIKNKDAICEFVLNPNSPLPDELKVYHAKISELQAEFRATHLQMNALLNENKMEGIHALKEKQKKLLSDLNEAKEREQKVVGRICFIRNQLQSYLPVTLMKTGRKDYAYSAQSDVPCAIPAKFCIPKEGSRFGSVYETFNCTLQSVLQEGVPFDIFCSGMDSLRLEAESLTELARDWKENPLLQEMQKIYPEKSLCSEMNKNDLQLIYSRMKQKPKLNLLFARKYQLPLIKYHTSKAPQNAHDLCSLFSKCYGFDGTPANWGSWPTRLGAPVLDKGTDGYTIELLKKKTNKITNNGIIVSSTSHEEPIDTRISSILDKFTAEQPDVKFKAFIDLGAEFKGINSNDIANSILDYFKKHPQNPPINGVVFFKGDDMYVLDRNGKETSYELSDIPINQRFTFYDNAHVVGTDVPQEPMARAIVTIGENLYLKDLLQAVWRMRGLGRLQTVSFLLNNEISNLIRAELKIDEKTPLSIEHIIALAAKNQAKRQVDDTYRGALKEIPALIRASFNNKIRELELGGKWVEASLLNEVANLSLCVGISDTKFNPLEEGVNPSQNIDVEKVFRDTAKTWAEQLKSFNIEGIDTQFIHDLIHRIGEWKPAYMDRMSGQIQVTESARDSVVEIEQRADTKKEVEYNIQNVVTSTNKEELPRPIWDEFDPFNPHLQIMREDEMLRRRDLPLRFNQSMIMPIESIFNKCFVPQELEELAEFAPLFKEIYVTYNHSPVVPINMNDQFTAPNNEFLGNTQKPFEHVLIRETGNPEKPLEYYFVDLIDVGILEKKLAQEKSKPQDQQAKIWLYSLSNRDFSLKTDAANPEKWMEDPQFLEIQAKMFILSGFSRLSQKEEDALKQLINAVGKEKFLKLLTLTRIGKRSKTEIQVYRRLLYPLVLTISPQERKFTTRKTQDRLRI